MLTKIIEVFTAVIENFGVFWNITPWSLTEPYRRSQKCSDYISEV
jgi:hypothetical protein